MLPYVSTARPITVQNTISAFEIIEFRNEFPRVRIIPDRFVVKSIILCLQSQCLHITISYGVSTTTLLWGNIDISKSCDIMKHIDLQRSRGRIIALSRVSISFTTAVGVWKGTYYKIATMVSCHNFEDCYRFRKVMGGQTHCSPKHGLNGYQLQKVSFRALRLPECRAHPAASSVT